MTDERTDLLTMSGQELCAEFVARNHDMTGADAFASMRDAIVTAARESDAAARIAAQREAASRAWDAAREFALSHQADRRGQFIDARNLYLDREHPLPARECVPEAKPPVLTWHEVGWHKRDLADETGRVVAHVDDCHGYLIGTGSIGRYVTPQQARDAVMKAALKSFAAGVGR